MLGLLAWATDRECSSERDCDHLAGTHSAWEPDADGLDDKDNGCAQSSNAINLYSNADQDPRFAALRPTPDFVKLMAEFKPH